MLSKIEVSMIDNGPLTTASIPAGVQQLVYKGQRLKEGSLPRECYREPRESVLLVPHHIDLAARFSIALKIVVPLMRR